MAIDPICGMTVDEATVAKPSGTARRSTFAASIAARSFLAANPISRRPTHDHHHEHTIRQRPAARHGKYICPMHPEVESDKPGSCPKCGMALEPARPAASKQKVIYTCPMHPEIEQDQPGTCPKCGMALEPKTVQPDARGRRLRTAEHDPAVLGRRRPDRPGACCSPCCR